MDRHCADCRELISAWLDGEASPDERAWLQNHLASCHECRAVVESYRSIGPALRSMPPVHPPEDLTAAIYASTIDMAPRRLSLITSRVGYSLAAVAAVLLVFVVAGYLLVGGYQRGLTPAVASSMPASHEQWPVTRPIEIRFNKDMNRESVEAALGIQPLGEEDRLSRSWDGNTLVIGQNETLKPGADYEVIITDDAVDRWGNHLASEFRLEFATVANVSAIETPTAVVATPHTTPTAQAVVQQTSTPDAVGTPGTPGSDLPDTGNNQPEVTATQGSGVVTVATATPTPAGDEPTSAASDPTRTPTPSPTGTPTPTEPAPTATPTQAYPTATATPTTAPTLTPTPDTIPVTGAFGSVYWGDDAIQARLGAPSDVAFNASSFSLGFQHGNMLYRGDLGLIYVMPDTGGWSWYVDSAVSYPQAEPGPEPGLYVPGGMFGFLWLENPSIQDELGYALADYSSQYDATIQEFDGGFMILVSDFVYVFYDDGGLDYFPASS